MFPSFAIIFISQIHENWLILEEFQEIFFSMNFCQTFFQSVANRWSELGGADGGERRCSRWSRSDQLLGTRIIINMEPLASLSEILATPLLFCVLARSNKRLD